MGKLRCSAFNCDNTSLSDVKLFKFPIDDRRNLTKWLSRMRWKDWTPSRFSVLCIDHFEEKYIDRTGTCIKLRKDAVPTKFECPKPRKKWAINPQSSRYQASTSEASETNPAQAASAQDAPAQTAPAQAASPQAASPQAASPQDALAQAASPQDPPTQAASPQDPPTQDPPTQDAPTQDAPAQAASPAEVASAQTAPPSPPETQGSSLMDLDQPRKFIRWTIITEEELATIESLPSFFHGDYCKPLGIRWAPDDATDEGCLDMDMVERMPLEDPERTILVREAWEWLGLDVRGPLPETKNGHKFILTVSDYYSKWVEALPMKQHLASQVATLILDITSHFGFPFRILSRLPQNIIKEINQRLKNRLITNLNVVVYHQQTGSLDLVTQRLIDSMVGDLVQQHAADWDVYLPAQVFSLCFKKHSQTKERPFSMLCCQGLQPVKTTRGHQYSNTTIQESTFVLL